MTGTRWLSLAALLSASAAAVLSWRYLGLDPGALWQDDSQAAMADYAARFLRPDLSGDHLAAVARGALETLAMSAVATLLAVSVGVLLALPASGRQGPIPRGVARFACTLLRSIPELVWAALMVVAVGLGPNAGTLALAAHTSGVLGRLYADALENTSRQPTDALMLAGSSRWQAFLYGTLPGLWPQMAAYGLYRWENNIRMAAILGVVGAGGLGQMLYMDLSLFREGRAATVILAMVVLVVVVDAFSGWVRLRRVGLRAA